MKRSQWTAFCAFALLLFSAMPVGAFEIGVRGYYWFPGFKADMKSDGAGLSGTDISYSGNYLYETLADLSLTPFPLLDIHAGYKVLRVHLDRDDLFLNADFAGPYLALTVSF